MRHRNGERNLHGGDRAILDRGLGVGRRGDRWLPDRWYGMPSQTGGGSFDPTTIAGLKLWLKADALALSDGASVNPWNDSSGNGVNFVSNGADSVPVFKSSIVNGKPVVRFNGTTQSLTNNGATVISGNYTIIAVAAPASVSAGSHVIFSSRALVNSSVYLYRAGVDWIGVQFGSSFVVNTDAGGAVANAWNVLTADWNGSNIHLWRNGALKATAGVTVIGNLGTINHLGSDESAERFDGDIAELLIYNSSLSDTDRHNVESYLSSKYGVTVTPGLRDILIERAKERQ